jgi:uncharacterized protein (TIGR02444 family)
LGRIEFDQDYRAVKLSRAELEADSWAFALDIYARPGIADACLKLQNEAGVDVMILLMVTFALARHRISLTPAEIGKLDEACRPWREQIVRPLRAIRSELKSGPRPAPSSETEQFRSKVKSLELAAERLQNRLLADNLPLRPGKIGGGADDLRSALASLVRLFLERRGNGSITDLVSSIDLIVDTTMQGAR